MSVIYTKTCKTCGESFETKRSNTMFCKRLCHRRYPDNRQKYNNRVKVYQDAHARDPNRRHQKLKFKASSEKRDFNLSLEDCLTLWDKGCIYCTSELYDTTGCALDRIDNSKGYTKDNVVPCCGVCNQIRNDHLTHEEMKVAMKAVTEYRKNNGNTEWSSSIC